MRLTKRNQSACDAQNPPAERATHCRECLKGLPADRLEVAREEAATGTSRGIHLAARLRSDLCLSCSDPKRVKGSDGAAHRPEGQRVGNGRVSS